MSNAKPDEPIKVSHLIGKPPKPRKRRGTTTRNAKRRLRQWHLAARYYRKLADRLVASGYSISQVQRLIRSYY